MWRGDVLLRYILSTTEMLDVIVSGGGGAAAAVRVVIIGIGVIVGVVS